MFLGVIVVVEDIKSIFASFPASNIPSTCFKTQNPYILNTNFIKLVANTINICLLLGQKDQGIGRESLIAAKSSRYIQL